MNAIGKACYHMFRVTSHMILMYTCFGNKNIPVGKKTVFFCQIIKK